MATSVAVDTGGNRRENETTAESTVTIDPAGDVLFNIDGTALQVSSKVLCVASGYFRAMFGPNFSEGRSLVQQCVALAPDHEPDTDFTESGAQSLPVLPLEEDNAAAITRLMQRLHFRDDSEAQYGTVEELEAFVLTCDKYQCIDAMHEFVSLWLKSLVSNVEDMKGSFRVCEAAYMLDDAVQFQSITRKILMKDKGDILKQVSACAAKSEDLARIYCMSAFNPLVHVMLINVQVVFWNTYSNSRIEFAAFCLATSTT